MKHSAKFRLIDKLVYSTVKEMVKDGEGDSFFIFGCKDCLNNFTRLPFKRKKNKPFNVYKIELKPEECRCSETHKHSLVYISVREAFEVMQKEFQADFDDVKINKDKDVCKENCEDCSEPVNDEFEEFTEEMDCEDCEIRDICSHCTLEDEDNEDEFEEEDEYPIGEYISAAVRSGNNVVNTAVSSDDLFDILGVVSEIIELLPTKDKIIFENTITGILLRNVIDEEEIEDE